MEKEEEEEEEEGVEENERTKRRRREWMEEDNEEGGGGGGSGGQGKAEWRGGRGEGNQRHRIISLPLSPFTYVTHIVQSTEPSGSLLGLKR